MADSEQTVGRLVPPEVAARWLRFRGRAAERWLTGLSDEIYAAADRWNMVVIDPLWGGTQSVTVAGRCGGTPVVLKIAAPWATWFEAEASALKAWGGHGAPRLLQVEKKRRALLMERIFPGVSPSQLSPEAVAEVIARLRPTTPTRLPPSIPALGDAVIQRFMRAEENRHGLVSEDLRRSACAAGVAFAADKPARPGLVHGDLVTKNILLSDRHGLAAIDPNPAQGDTAYDAALWTVTQPDPADFSELAARVGRSLGIDVASIVRWMLILAVPEACLAPLPRAEASLAFVKAHQPPWF